MDLFVVIRFGVYDQGVFCICDSVEKAKKAATDAEAIECDNYHNFRIEKMPLNTYPPIDKDEEPFNTVYYNWEVI